MTISLKADAGGTSGFIQINGVDKVTVGASGIAAGSYAPGSVTPTELSQKLTSGTAQNTTSGTSIDFTGIPSWAKRITVMFSGVSTNGNSNPQIQLGDSDGIENTGYTSYSIQTGTTTVTSGANYTSGFGIAVASAANTMQGSVVISKIDGNTWVASGILYRSDTPGSMLCGGSKTLSDTLTQVRITTVNGTDTFDAGTINIMYE